MARDLDAAKTIVTRVFHRAREDRLTLVAAGVAFYLLLAIFPALAGLASVYGLFTDPALLDQQLERLSAIAPEPAIELMRAQLEEFIGQAEGRFGFGLLLGVAAAIWAVNRGVSTLFMAMNIVYEQEETRGYFRKMIVTLAFSVGVLLLAAAWVFVLGFAQLALRPLGIDAETASLVRWPLLFVLAALSVGLIYRYGPSRRPVKLRWIAWGGGLATLAWFAGSAIFSWYLEGFGGYDATYGSLAAVAGLMIWLWMSAFFVLVGAELNAELERRARSSD